MTGLLYRLFYRLGITPGEKMASLPIAAQIEALVASEEPGREPPYGAALDLGCGTGVWSVRLARRGWDVTGVELVRRALGSARERARDARANVRRSAGR